MSQPTAPRNAGMGECKSRRDVSQKFPHEHFDLADVSMAAIRAWVQVPGYGTFILTLACSKQRLADKQDKSGPFSGQAGSPIPSCSPLSELRTTFHCWRVAQSKEQSTEVCE